MHARAEGAMAKPHCTEAAFIEILQVQIARQMLGPAPRDGRPRSTTTSTKREESTWVH